MRKQRMNKRTWRSGICGLIALTPVCVASNALAEGEMSMCPEDIDQNEVVDVNDFSILLVNYGMTGSNVADINGDFVVDFDDFTLMLTGWGACPHDHMDPCMGEFVDITCWGDFHGSNNNSHHDELVGGRTPITTEAMLAYNDLRAFFGLSSAEIEEVGQWAFDESLTNNSQAWGNDLLGVGLWYAMQGAKVGWIADDKYDPQIMADIQRTARLVEDPVEMKSLVMDMVRDFSHAGYADYLEDNGLADRFINTLKMEPHYGGWMHGRTHGFRSIEGVAINHDVNHLPVLSWDQMQPFMNDTFDWPQWPALNVSDSGVIEYFQSMVNLGDPVGNNL
jgi:hypothetical protein